MDSPSSSILSTREKRIPYARNLDRSIFFLLLVLEFHERGAKTRTSSVEQRAYIVI